MTGYGKTNHSRHFVETEINTPSERTFIADHNGAFIFFNRTFLCKVMSFWMRTIRKLISIARGTYNARKFWMRRTSGLIRGWTIAWKYAYKNLTLYSGSPTHSVVMHVRSSAHDRSLPIDYWTLNSRNVNSMFAASGRFFHSRSHLQP